MTDEGKGFISLGDAPQKKTSKSASCMSSCMLCSCVTSAPIREKVAGGKNRCMERTGHDGTRRDLSLQ